MRRKKIIGVLQLGNYPSPRYYIKNSSIAWEQFVVGKSDVIVNMIRLFKKSSMFNFPNNQADLQQTDSCFTRNSWLFPHLSIYCIFPTSLWKNVRFVCENRVMGDTRVYTAWTFTEGSAWISEKQVAEKWNKTLLLIPRLMILLRDICSGNQDGTCAALCFLPKNRGKHLTCCYGCAVLFSPFPISFLRRQLCCFSMSLAPTYAWYRTCVHCSLFSLPENSAVLLQPRAGVAAVLGQW